MKRVVAHWPKRVRRAASGRERAQAMVEMALSLILFLTFTMGVIDIGRAVYLYNGLSNLAREASHEALMRYTSNGSSACYWNNFSGGGCLSAIKSYTLGLQMMPGISNSKISFSMTVDCGSNGKACTPGIPVSVSLSTQFQPIIGTLLGIGPFPISAVSTSQFVLPVSTPTPISATATPCTGTCPTAVILPTPTVVPKNPPTNLTVAADSSCTSNCETFDLSWTPPTNLAAVGHYEIQFGAASSYVDLVPIPPTDGGITTTNTVIDLGAPVHSTCIKLIAAFTDGTEYPATASWHDGTTGAPSC